ncbi:hypothetical protein [Paenibacillus sp. J2TS4]|uniref:hypothetical protein n=1 Tax=Paenibacillus sp. J2TS4 TaxID=2807194 RepID=UPI001B0B5441|nr:hypothetical protein [Paenibacillus sp. J2TS4]GIP32981.1 hypothetical protein J2TS4_21910 [Paenibacillus sp. J2TS4]
MKKQHRLILILVFVVMLSSIIYLFVKMQTIQQRNNDRESKYVQIMEFMIETTLKEDAYITEQERKNASEWNRLFENYGIHFSNGNQDHLKIPNDNPEIRKLLPLNAEPIIFEKDDTAIYFRYDIEKKRYDFAYYNAENKIIKSVYLLLEDSNNIVKIANENNEEFNPTVNIPFYRK